ncbi:MAG TPA: methyltransferase domain-containing protein [Armatimonadota bacterium]|nr:methyltransferase domain-containing protein [Armatimonadota bacterium]
MRQVPPWVGYDRMAATGEYGALVNAAGELALSSDGQNEAAFFRSVLRGRNAVLDVGCGPGFPLVVLAHCVTSPCGLDAAPAMLALARATIAALGVRNATLVRGMAEALPFADNAFDGFAVCGTLGSVPDPAPVVRELARVAAAGAVVASIGQDFRHRLSAGKPRGETWLRCDRRGLALQVVRYLTDPYRIWYERHVLDPASDFAQQLLADPELCTAGRIATDLSPRDLPAGAVLDSFCEEEAQFDPETLREVFEQSGFATERQHVALSYGVPHIFSVFRRRG